MLIRLPETDEDSKNKEVDLEKEIWLQTLPSCVRVLLHNTDEMFMDDLSTLADEIMMSQNAARHDTSRCDARPKNSRCDACPKNSRCDACPMPADVRHPLLEADFLSHYSLMVDVARHRLLNIDSFTSTPLCTSNIERSSA